MDASLTLKFAGFELQPENHRLLQDGEAVAIGGRAFDLLLALVQRRGCLMSKAELLDRVWPGLVVEENNLQVQISTLRKLLGPQAIVTVPGRGYRFCVASAGAADARGPAAANPGTQAPAGRLSNLPEHPAVLYGRQADLVVLRSLVHAHALVTVLGAGGIGKSSLAQAAARSLAERWVDGTWMVELAKLSDPALVLSAVAQALAITIADPVSALDELVAAMAPRSLLLVLDNCEHVLDAVAHLVQAVLLGAPRVSLLLTSQQPLHLPAEQQYRLAPLDVPGQAGVCGAREFGAVALFEARVRAVEARFQLDESALPPAIDICRRLDGMPLAIELAAARAATIGLLPVRDKLDARFKLLTGVSRAALPRHQTLRATLEWSHQLLDEAEQTLFRRLGVFVGGFSMELAQAVASDARADEWAVMDQLASLVDKSLIVADAADPPRYRLLESARAYALEQLDGAGETATLQKRHAHAVRAFFERVDGPNLDGELRTDQLRALLLPELDNLRAAHAWARGEPGELATATLLAACANALEDFAFETTDWLLPLELQVERLEKTPAVTARFWRALASINVTMTGRLGRAAQARAAATAHAAYLRLGQPRRAFSSLALLAFHRMALDQHAQAQEAADAARTLMQPDWPAMLRVRMLRLDAHRARSAGSFVQALALHRNAIRVSVLTGDWVLELMARENLADLLWQIGPIEEAAAQWRALVDDLHERPLTALDMGDPFVSLMAVLAEMGRIDEASRVAGETLALMRRTRVGRYLGFWAYLMWRRDQRDVAVRLLGALDAAQLRRGAVSPQNERRLTDLARSDLQARLEPHAFASALLAGAAMSESELLGLLAEGLAEAGVLAGA